jgi:hypothetical protein
MVRMRSVPCISISVALVAAAGVFACSSAQEGATAPVAAAPDASAGDAAPDTGDGLEPVEVQVVAGTSSTGFADGKGEGARFNGPAGGVLLPDGSAVIVADTFNAVLRRVELGTGEVRTVAGRVQVQATVDGLGNAARFQSPRAMVLAPDGRQAFVADGPTLRRVDLSTFETTTLAGTAGEPGYVDGKGAVVRLGFLQHALEISEDGSILYIADRSNQTLRTLDTKTLTVSTFAGARYSGAPQAVDGTGANARFSGLGGLARLGNALFVADTFNHCIRRVSLVDAQTTTVAGRCGESGQTDGIAQDARFDTPQTLVALSDALYSTSFSGTLRRISLSDFRVETVAGTVDDVRSIDGPKGTARLGAGFAQPMPDKARGVLWLNDRDANSLRSVDLATFKVTTLAGPVNPTLLTNGPVASARFEAPGGVAATGDGKTYFVSEAFARVIRRVDTATGSVETIAGNGSNGATDGPAKTASFVRPTALTFDAATQTLFIADGSRLRALSLETGAVSTVAGKAPPAGEPQDGDRGVATFAGIAAMAMDGAGLVVGDVRASQTASLAYAALRSVDPKSGSVRTIVGGRAASKPSDGTFAEARFASIDGIAVDGEGKRVFVADATSASIRVVDLATETVSLYAGAYGEEGPGDGPLLEARFNAPLGLALRSAEAALYVSDVGGHTIRRIALGDAVVKTYLGDPALQGGLPFGVRVPAPGSFLYAPEAITVDGNALVFLSEQALYGASPRRSAP